MTRVFSGANEKGNGVAGVVDEILVMVRQNEA